jgi:putative oxidoreductase
MAVVAGVSELGGGLLTAAGIADPLGPLTLIGTMAVASATHRAKGPLAARGGFELPLTNLAAAAALAAAGPGRLSVGPRLPRPLTAAAAAVGAALAAGSLARLLSARPAAADELRSAAADEPARAGAGTAVPEAAGTGEER